MQTHITVFGSPAPQGSKRFVGMKNGRGMMVESSKAVKPWREAVVWAARESGIKVAGAVTVAVIFTVPKPASAPKRRTTYPDRKPDIDKLIRSTFDALKTAGTIEDDARVIHLAASKVFPGEHPDALDVPGAVIRISGVDACGS
jgi:Holliday junction resolvase RusA-like endonuclease